MNGMLGRPQLIPVVDDPFMSLSQQSSEDTRLGCDCNGDR